MTQPSASALVSSLCERWDAAEASVFADWVEEHLRGVFPRLADMLRVEPTAQTRALLDCLRSLTSEGPELHLATLLHWQLNWLPGYEPTAKEKRFQKRGAAAWGRKSLTQWTFDAEGKQRFTRGAVAVAKTKIGTCRDPMCPGCERRGH